MVTQPGDKERGESLQTLVHCQIQSSVVADLSTIGTIEAFDRNCIRQGVNRRF